MGGIENFSGFGLGVWRYLIDMDFGVTLVFEGHRRVLLPILLFIHQLRWSSHLNQGRRPLNVSDGRTHTATRSSDLHLLPIPITDPPQIPQGHHSLQPSRITIEALEQRPKCPFETIPDRTEKRPCTCPNSRD